MSTPANVIFLVLTVHLYNSVENQNGKYTHFPTEAKPWNSNLVEKNRFADREKCFPVKRHPLFSWNEILEHVEKSRCLLKAEEETIPPRLNFFITCGFKFKN